jgi:hypothetical protein
MFALIFVASASLVVRLHHARGVERQQIKWVANAGALAASASLPTYTVFEAMDLRWIEMVGYVPALVGILGVPTAVGIAILRYRLYGIDIVINRTLVYGSLTTTLIALYIGGALPQPGGERGGGRLPGQARSIGGPGSTSYGPPVLLRGKAGLTKVCLYGPFQASQQLLRSSGAPGACSSATTTLDEALKSSGTSEVGVGRGIRHPPTALSGACRGPGGLHRSLSSSIGPYDRSCQPASEHP